MNETWRVHPVLTDYEVSDLGQVRRLTAYRSTVVGRVLRPHLNTDGYRVTRIGGKERRIHILVLQTFVGPCPDGHWGLHGDDNKENNALGNLSWGPYAKNYQDWVRNGGGRHGSRCYAAKLSEENVPAIRARYAEGGISLRELAEEYGVHTTAIHQAVNRHTWKHV